jgi:polysaccharide biosynthesis protein PslH
MGSGRRRKGRVLVVTPYPPTPPFAGGRKRIQEMIAWLSRSVEVTVASVTFNNQDERLLSASLPEQVRVVYARPCKDGCSTAVPSQFRWAWSHELADKIFSLDLIKPFDAVIAEHSYAFPYTARLGAMPRLLTAHNIEHRVYEQFATLNPEKQRQLLKLAGHAGDGFSLAAKETQSLASFEREVWRSADIIFCVSPSEHAEIARLTGARIHYIPNCACGPIQRVVAKRSERATISFAGTLNYVPNVDAIVRIAERVAPIVRRRVPNLRIVVAGRDPTRELIQYCANRSVEVISNPIDMSAIIRSTAFVCPLRLGAGTRIKVLDARRNGVVVFANPFTVDGLDVTADPGIVVRNGIDQLGLAIGDYLRSGSPSVEQSTAAVQWQQVFAVLGSVIAEVI